jgi:hypothetical protein
MVKRGLTYRVGQVFDQYYKSTKNFEVASKNVKLILYGGYTHKVCRNAAKFCLVVLG